MKLLRIVIESAVSGAAAGIGGFVIIALTSKKVRTELRQKTATKLREIASVTDC